MQSLTLKANPVALKPFTTSFFDRSYWDTLFGDIPIQTSSVPIDVVQRESEYEVRVHIPNMDKENVKINLDGRRLSVNYTKTEDKNTYYLKETTQQNISRLVLLPSDIDEKQVSKASYENGVLKMTIGKIQNEPPRLIEIE